MTSPKNLLARVFARLQRRFRSARPGSVLILVVALLVLMALLGTAYIATARSDRYTAVQHTKNTQIDMLVESVLNMVVPLVQDDMYDQTPGLAAFRPADRGANPPNGYDHWDSHAYYTPTDTTQITPILDKIPNDAWLASRDCRTQTVGNWPNFQPYEAYNGITVLPIWDSVSYPPIRNGPTAVTALPQAFPWHFDSMDPVVPSLDLSLPFRPLPNNSFQQNGYPECYVPKPWMSPNFKEFPANSGTIYPSFVPYWWQRQPGTGTTHEPIFFSGLEFIAADTDGDGIADAGLWKIPDARIDGITYYAAIRIVDNNSAVNVNTAWTNRDFPFTGTAPLPATEFPRYFTPASVGLNEMLRTFVSGANGVPLNATAQGTELAKLDQYRLNGQTPTTAIRDPVAPAGPIGTTEYSYPRFSEYLYTQLGMRMSNPGYIAGGPQGGVKYQALSAGDQGALGYRGQLLNPDATPSLLESIFFNNGSASDSLYRSVWNFGSRQTSYPSNKTNGTGPWMTKTWDFANEAIGLPAQPVPNMTFLQKRGLMVTSNPVSNTAPVHPLDITPGVTSSLYALNAGILPYSAAVNTTYSPQRVSINQAPFLDLWRAYWNVMADLSVLPYNAGGPLGGAPIVYGSPFDVRVLYATYYEADRLRPPFISAAPDPAVNNATSNPLRVRLPNNPPIFPNEEVLDPPTFNSPYVGMSFDEYYEAATTTVPTTVNGSTAVTPADSFKPNTLRNDATFTAARLPYYTPPQAPLPTDQPAPVDHPQSYTDTHPAHQFKSPMRSIPDPDATEANNNNADPNRPEMKGFSRNTPRMNAQQVALLRSAISAVNAEALRDSDADVNAERVVLKVSRGVGANNINNANQLVPVDVVVYGMERQPFITEVYAETETADPEGGLPGTANPYGYVAIELYNPYDQDILLKNWKLVALDRRSASTVGNPVLPPYLAPNIDRNPPGHNTTFNSPGGGSSYNIPLDQSCLIADFDTSAALHPLNSQDVILPDRNGVALDYATEVTAGRPLCVPRHGYLILENYYQGSYGLPAAPAGAALHRPPATGLMLQGPGTTVDAGPYFFNEGTDRSPEFGGPGNSRAALPAPQVNLACVPGLSGMLDPGWETADWPVTVGTGVRSVLNRELVILRPRRADGQYSVGAYREVAYLNEQTYNPTKGVYPPLPYNEVPNPRQGLGGTPDVNYPIAGANESPYSHLRDLVPVDSFDFTGLVLPNGALIPPRDEPLGRPTVIVPGTPQPNTSVAWHYARQNVDVYNQPNMTTWTFVYPGRYNGNPGQIQNPNPSIQFATALGDARPRQQGTETTAWTANNNGNIWNNGGVATGTVANPALPTTPITLGGDRSASPAIAALSTDNPFSSFPTSFKIPLGVTNSNVTVQASSALGPGPLPAGAPFGQNPPYTFAPPPTQFYPFGGIARNGDLLSIPFIGACRITYLKTPPVGVVLPQYGADFTIAELNSVTMDASFAEDADTLDDPWSARPLSCGNQPSDDNPPAGGAPGTFPGSAGLAEREQVGRFCPIRVIRPANPGPPLNLNPAQPLGEFPDYVLVSNPPSGRPPYNKVNWVAATAGANGNEALGVVANDYGYDPSYRSAAPASGIANPNGMNYEPFWRYHWASDLFDYLTTWSPSDDYQPNYPLQQIWHEHTNPNDPNHPGWPAVPDTRYYPGDLVSFFLPGSNGRHSIFRYEGNAPRDESDPTAPLTGNNWREWWSATPVQNASAVASYDSNTDTEKHTEDDVPIEGLININTAGWRVLSTLPLVVNPLTGLPDDTVVPGFPGSGSWGNTQPTYRQLNAELAKAICFWRDVDANPDPNIFAPHGPFKSFYELQQVVDLRPQTGTVPGGPTGYPRGTSAPQGGTVYTLPGFMNGYGTTPLPNSIPPLSEPDDSLGDLGPINVGIVGPLNPYLPRDGVRGDYKERYLNLTRISNLITTRSDSFTVYILVQGWRNAGSTDLVNFPPKAVIEKRAAYIIDRSHATQAKPTVTKIPFNNN